MFRRKKFKTWEQLTEEWHEFGDTHHPAHETRRLAKSTIKLIRRTRWLIMGLLPVSIAFGAMSAYFSITDYRDGHYWGSLLQFCLVLFNGFNFNNDLNRLDKMAHEIDDAYERLDTLESAMREQGLI